MYRIIVVKLSVVLFSVLCLTGCKTVCVFSSKPGTAISYSWVYKNPRFPRISSLALGSSDPLDYVHMGMLSTVASGYLLSAWQGASVFWEGSMSQGIYTSLSKDNGESWNEPKLTVASQHGTPLWAPVLHTQGNTSWLFYSESRPSCWWWGEGGLHWACGGDLKVITSSDSGVSWSSPKVVLSFDEEGGIAKMLANKLQQGPRGEWLLPFWREMGGHNCSNAPEMHGRAGVLISADQGKTWRKVNVQLAQESPQTWLIEAALAGVRMADGRENESSYLQVFRTQVGRIYSSRSRDGEAWTDALPMNLPNPNSKVDMIALPDGLLVLAFNDSPQNRTPLTLAVSDDGGGSWHRRLVLEDHPEASFAYPTLHYLPTKANCTSLLENDLVVVIYTVGYPPSRSAIWKAKSTWWQEKRWYIPGWRSKATAALEELALALALKLRLKSHVGTTREQRNAWGLDDLGLRLASIPAHQLRLPN